MSRHKTGSFYVKVAKENGLRVENGRGDHVKVYGGAGRGYMVVPQHRELADGTECAIKKWFKALGILLALASPVICVVAGLAGW